MEDNNEELSEDETKSLTEAIEKVEEACKSDNTEDIDKAVEELSKVAQPLSDKLFKKEQAQAQENSDDEGNKDQTDEAVDAEFKEVDDEKVILLSEYVYSQVEHLDSIRDEDIVSGNITWLAMPGIDESKNNDAENANWREALSEDGRKYWWNIETRESTWRDPTTSN